jgi:asparagine synthase (glutamine-hydrolysing)
MCGICGIVYTSRGRRVPEDSLLHMRQALIHRGPDDAGIIVEENIGLAHQRLSIVDLSARGHQPMDSASRRFCVTYNGEIYNYRALRAELQARGYRFRSDSDTEVLVEGLEEWGLLGLLSQLDGIFAFAAWDRRERRLLAARDQLGVKPFYYSQTADAFLFASEIKALWGAGIPREADPDALEELLVFRFVAGEGTPFLRVRRLLPGHYLELSAGQLLVRPYWKATDHVGSDYSYIRHWRSRFSQAVRDQLVSDVPLGVLLSGGLDSSTVTAEVAQAAQPPVQTFTVSLPPGEGVDEWPYAEAVAKRWNCVSHRLRIPTGEVLQRLRVAQSYHDEPFAFGNDMHIFEVSRLAKRYVTVLLSGEGGDETLGGYTRYEPVRYPTGVKLATSIVGAPLRAILGLAPSRKVWRLHRLLSVGSFDQVLLYNSARLLPWDLQRIGFHSTQRFEVRRALLEAAMRQTPEPVRQLMLYDLQTFLCSILDRNDRMTMAASIECRVPFLAVGVVEAALKLPVSALFSGRYGKMVLRDHAAELLPRKVLTRPKWGLGIPWERYFRHDPACRDFVSKLPRSNLARALDAPGLPAAVSAFLNGDDRQAPIVYEVFTLAVWWEQVVEGDIGLGSALKAAPPT